MMSNLTLLVQLAVGLVLFRSALGKALAPRAFAAGIKEYGVFASFASVLAALVIVAESVAAAAYVSGWHLRFIAPLSVGLLIIFLLVVARALRRGLDVRCLCFGASKRERVSNKTLLRVALLLLAAIFVSVQGWRGLHWPAPLQLPATQMAVAFGCALLLIVPAAWVTSASSVKALFIGCKTCAEVQ